MHSTLCEVVADITYSVCVSFQELESLRHKSMDLQIFGKKKITSEVQTNQANIQNYKQLAVCHDMADPDSKLSVVNDNM